MHRPCCDIFKPMASVTFRQARTLLAASKHASITGAARAINRSQTSVTKSLQDLERVLGVELFNRTSKGITPTAYGKTLVDGARNAREAIAAAGRMVTPIALARSPSVKRFFELDISDKWVDALLAVAEHQSFSGAAAELNVTTAAVSSNVRKLEDSLGMTLFTRLPNASVPTEFARELVRHIKLARNHLRHTCEELESLQGKDFGRVVLGSLPFLRVRILPRAIKLLQAEHPRIDIETVEGPHDEQIAGLRCGDLDFLIGDLQGASQATDLIEEPLFDDELSVVVRQGHPLQQATSLEWATLLDYEWVIPRRRMPARDLIDQALADEALGLPRHVIETGSTVLLRGLLMESDHLAIISRRQVHLEVEHGLLAVLPFSLPGVRRQIGITTRQNSSMSPAAAVLLEKIRDVSAALEA